MAVDITRETALSLARKSLEIDDHSDEVSG
jgi:hypothetical protein